AGSPAWPARACFVWLRARASVSRARRPRVSVGGRGLASAIASGEIHAALVHEPMATRLLEEGRATLLGDFRTPAAVSRALGMQTVNAAVFLRADRRPADAHLPAFPQPLLSAPTPTPPARARTLT